jgi:hypothetical protein
MRMGVFGVNSGVLSFYNDYVEDCSIGGERGEARVVESKLFGGEEIVVHNP